MALSNYDIFRKVPRDLTSATRPGGVLSIFVMCLIGLVLTFETWTYFAGETRSKIVLDSSSEPKLDVHFEVSFYELPCRFATIEAWDYLGKSKLDVTSNIEKTMITGKDGEVIKGRYEHRPIPQPQNIRQIDDSIPGTGLVVDATTHEFAALLKELPFTFVFYYVKVSFFLSTYLPVFIHLSAHASKNSWSNFHAYFCAMMRPVLPHFLRYSGVHTVKWHFLCGKSLPTTWVEPSRRSNLFKLTVKTKLPCARRAKSQAIRLS